MGMTKEQIRAALQFLNEELRLMDVKGEVCQIKPATKYFIEELLKLKI